MSLFGNRDTGIHALLNRPRPGNLGALLAQPIPVARTSAGLWNLTRTVKEFMLALSGSAAEAKCLLINAMMVGGLRDDEWRCPIKAFQ
ncbi:hypothetical protein MFIFM68171_03324 [Madurella fahalii]|uniref:Uncharacterized protein n=1 Tax=Madurella fahalii TaxID=1157608 RepID=A0ABQ0G5S9_9PEZI